MFWKASDQGRTPRLVPEQNEEFNEKKKTDKGRLQITRGCGSSHCYL